MAGRDVKATAAPRLIKAIVLSIAYFSMLGSFRPFWVLSYASSPELPVNGWVGLLVVPLGIAAEGLSLALSQETARDSLETTERQPGDTEFAGGYAVRHSALGYTLQKDREFHRAVRRLAVNCNKQTSRCFSPSSATQ